MTEIISIPEKEINNDDDNSVSIEKNKFETVNEPNFTEVFKNFIDFSLEILKYKMSNEIKLESVGGSSIIRTYLNNYNTIFLKTPKSTKHVIQIQEAWKICEPHLTYISSTVQEPDIEEFATWLEKYSVSIKPPTENSKAKIMISSIFNNALKIVQKLMNDAEAAESKGKQDEANKIYDNTAIHYSNYFLLHLFRIFQFDVKTITENGNKVTKICYSPIPIVSASIKKLEETLGLSENEIPETGGELGDLLGSVPELINSLGIEMPAELTGKNKSMKGGIKAAMNDIRTNPETKHMVQNLLSGINMKDPASLATALNRVMAGMQQNAMNVPDAVKKANAATSDTLAIESSSSSTK